VLALMYLALPVMPFAPFVPEGRVASLMVRDAALASRLADGFETLWARAMRSLREISFQPG
jgi:HTH-type transcriptional regulator, sugar sensing transcriptional regulator